MNSNHIPPGHQHSQHPHAGHDTRQHPHPGHGHSSLNKKSDTPGTNLPSGIPRNVQHEYETWWKVFQYSIQGCGKQHTPHRNPRLRVIGGLITTVDSYPWMVSMYSTLILQPWCAGTLIAPQWVVTAAHCFRGPFAIPAAWTIHMGKNNASGFAEYGDEQVRTILKVFKHPMFNDIAGKFKFDNDIALLKLDRPVVFNPHTSPLCLVRSTDHVTDPIKADTKCTITGYGISNIIDVHSELNALHVANVPLVEKNACSHIEAYEHQLTDNMICAGPEAGGVDTCNGDSGGPLQCEIDGTWYHVEQYDMAPGRFRITSWGGDKCAERGKPGVYTDVSKYTDWIYTHIFHDYAINKHWNI